MGPGFTFGFELYSGTPVVLIIHVVVTGWPNLA